MAFAFTCSLRLCRLSRRARAVLRPLRLLSRKPATSVVLSSVNASRTSAVKMASTSPGSREGASIGASLRGIAKIRVRTFDAIITQASSIWPAGMSSHSSSRCLSSSAISLDLDGAVVELQLQSVGFFGHGDTLCSLGLPPPESIKRSMAPIGKPGQMPTTTVHRRSNSGSRLTLRS
jgi:hypothetical protein